MLQVMERYPFGKFIISAGIGFAATFAFVRFGLDWLESVAGEAVAPYVFVVLIGLSVIAVGFFNDSFGPKVTIPVGVVGWLVTFMLLYAHYSSQ